MESSSFSPLLKPLYLKLYFNNKGGICNISNEFYFLLEYTAITVLLILQYSVRT